MMADDLLGALNASSGLSFGLEHTYTECRLEEVSKYATSKGTCIVLKYCEQKTGFIPIIFQDLFP